MLWLIALYIIRALHVLFIAFMLIVPFCDSIPLLVLHAVTCPCLLVHWWTGERTCALTLLERWILGSTDDASFFFKLVDPVYSIPQHRLSFIIQTLTIGLWFGGMLHLYMLLEKNPEWKAWRGLCPSS